ncbi:hypothetical protein CRG98_033798 [Punica granatum]|uniref:Uncharacterized protein n=1 Tax=Punica granatum TaxID=22663 RepID=A0A2I0IP60_PUNGR|nr:hypothetical protein CRG98_033798 [Punica granatum]
MLTVWFWKRQKIKLNAHSVYGALDPVIDGYGRWTQCDSSPKGSGSIRITNKCKNLRGFSVNKKNRHTIGLDRIGSDWPSRRRNRPEEKLDRSVGPSLQRKRNGPRPVSRRAAEIGGSGGDEVGGGGSRPWTPRRRHERARVTVLDTADASSWSI